MDYFIKISIKKLVLFTVSLPFVAVITCVLLTLYKNFEKANDTHCNVPNVIPSISTSIGHFEPQISIWRSAIYTHVPLRFFLIYLRWNYYKRVIIKNYAFQIKLAVCLNILENLSLVALTHWTSSKHYGIHVACFIMFTGSSIFYMFSICMMLTKYRQIATQTNVEKYSIKLKWIAFLVNVGSLAFTIYFYLRHHSFCEPYVQSMFAFSEHFVAVSNIIFHMTTVYDLQEEFIF